MTSRTDMTGMEFGHLVVQNQTRQSRDANGSSTIQRLCLCVCGQSVWRSPRELRSGDYKSCGCMRNIRAPQPTGLKPTRRDLTDRRFGRLLVTGDGKASAKPNGKYEWLWLCRCDCGNETFVRGNCLVSGNTTSCDCYRKERVSASASTHRMSKTRTFRIWGAMHDRCRNANLSAAHRYVGRGIAVCDRWSSFENFLADMGEVPEGKTLDRINNDGGYEPGNCRWVSRKEQARNRANNRRITYRNKTQPLSAWCEELNLKRSSVESRLKDGWSVDRAFETAVRPSTPPSLESRLMRSKIPKKNMIVCLLLNLKRADGSYFLPDHLRGKDVDVDVVLKAIEWDHIVPVAIGGSNEFWNLQPLLKEDHRKKTSHIDVPQIAKTKRLAKAHEEFRRKMLAKVGVATEPESRVRKVSRWAARKMQSRPFQKREKRNAR